MKKEKQSLIQQKYKLAQLAKAVYSPYEVDTPGFLYRADISDSEMAVYEDITQRNRAVVAFKGTDPNPMEVGLTQWWNDISNDALIVAGRYGSSKRVSESSLKVLELPYEEIILTGHSLGGATAYEVGKRTGLPSYSFSTGSVPWDKTDYGEHYYHKQDLISSGIKSGHQSRENIGNRSGFGIGGVLYDTIQAHNIDQFIGTEDEMEPVPWKKSEHVNVNPVSYQEKIPVDDATAEPIIEMKQTDRTTEMSNIEDRRPHLFLRETLNIQRRRGVEIEFV